MGREKSRSNRNAICFCFNPLIALVMGERSGLAGSDWGVTCFETGCWFVSSGVPI